MAPARHRHGARPVLAAVAGLKNLFRRWRSPDLLLPDSLWSKTLKTSLYARALPEDERTHLRHLTTQLIRAKSFEGASGLRVNETMRARIALHAAIPVLHLGIQYYDDWKSIVIYPGDFRVQDDYMDEDGIVHREIMDLCGQSLSQGPIVLSWETLREEDETPGDHDLVIHECAHKLDILNGDANGFPPLHTGMNAPAWTREFRAAYRQLCSRLNASDASLIDPYAAEDPAEFFAVVSEAFFTVPHRIYGEFPAVYNQLVSFYRQDPRRFIMEKTS